LAQTTETQPLTGGSDLFARPAMAVDHRSIMVSEPMSATVKLKDIIEALEELSDEFTYFVDPDSGEVKPVSKDLLRDAEEFEDDDEEPDLPAWQMPAWELAKRIFSTGRFKHLPSKFDVHEWAIMQDFAFSIEPAWIREDLLNAIHGAGAFRNFRDVLQRRRIESAWFEFRTEALGQIALGWCKLNHIAWE
jgi:hypothetical protein